jgi:hypothetical protein
MYGGNVKGEGIRDIRKERNAVQLSHIQERGILPVDCKISKIMKL